MKRIVVIVLATIGLTSFRNPTHIKANHSLLLQDMFGGTWKYQNGNDVFIVTLWRDLDGDGYRGHYKKITVDACGNQVAEIYNSNKPIGHSTTNWPYVINSGNISQYYSIGGPIDDNTVTNTPNAGGFIEGSFVMKILNPNCYTPPTNACSLQAQWTVKKDYGLGNPAEPDFNIPTNVVLTKQ